MQPLEKTKRLGVMKLTGATLFSGIGAPEVAMPGWHWPWHAEIEKFPSAVMDARHPHSQNLGDVSADDFCKRAAAIARPDILVFGSPCQSYSVAGKRLGMDDPRGNLALVALGIVGRLKPRWFTFENVPGLFSSFSGSEHKEREVREGDVGRYADGEESRDLATFLARVHELGYSGAWASLDAQYFGVAQRRERLFFVGHIGDWRYPAAVLLEPEGLCGNPPARRQTGQGVAISPTIRAGGNRTGGDRPPGTDVDTADSLIVAFDTTQITSKGNYSKPEPGDPCHPLASTAHVPAIAFNITPSNSNKDFNAREAAYAQALTGGGNRPSARGGDLIAFSCKDHGADASELAPTLRAMGHTGSHPNAGGQVAIAVALRGREGGGTAELSEVPSALRASQGGGDKPHVLTSAVRRLTPRECERLQGFPDDYTLITYRGKPAADGPRYKALGNSMAVPVMRWILSRIEAVDALSSALAEAAE
jgi:DNA (cytosine-5)-methyltransferase 1